jgi:hypothetical protein
MIIHLAKEFDEVNWYPDYKKIKKLLRQNNVLFVIKKQPTDKGLLHSIWANSEHIDQVRKIVSSYYMDEPSLMKQRKRVDELSKDFESNWYLYIIALIYHYGRWHPFVFWPIFITLLWLMILPVLWYV